MITVFHLIYWTMKQVYNLCRNIPQLNAEQELAIDKNYFEKSKVSYSNAINDAETGLKFDPLVYLQRYSAVQDILLHEKWREKIVKVVDFGCAELKFFKYLKNLINIQEVLLVDIDGELLRNNSCRVQPFSADYLSRRAKPFHVEVIQGSVDCPDPKLISVDAVICIEIIEHLYPDTLDALPHNIFNFIQPRIALFTTPNADFNVLFKNFSGIRHYDHKFEWSRQQFEDWAQNIVLRYPNYSVYFLGIGAGPKYKDHLGCCSQMAVFIKKDIVEDDSRKNLVEALSKNSTNLSLKDCIEGFDEYLSHGVCTYQSYVANLLPNDGYNVICEVDHPHVIDNRTEEEIILHETEYRLHRLASLRKFYDYESDRVHIPLYELTSNTGGEFISMPELKTILQKSGWKIEENDVDGIQTPCVIYELAPSSVSSLRSPSPNLNFSTEANWDSGSQWDMDEYQKMEESVNESNVDIWEDASTDFSNTKENSPKVSDEENSPLSDPCTSGEQIGRDEKVELLFDSGYQISSSSIELSPDLSKDWLSEKEDARAESKEETLSAPKSEGHIQNPGRRNKKVEEARVPLTEDVEDEIPWLNEKEEARAESKERTLSAPKSEGHVQKPRRRNKKVEEPRVPLAVAVEVENLVEIPVVVENGDLANNNRDVEGNNYQAVENHLEQIDDNAVPRLENLDEHNENHIVLEAGLDQIVDQIVDPILDYEEDDAAESLEDASREVLFDPNSDLHLPEDTFRQYNIPIIQIEFPLGSQEDFHTPMGFPTWLLQMLNINRDDLDLEEENPHFYSQGDGVGVHPSTTEVSDDSSSSSSSQTTTEREITTPNTTAVASEETLTADSRYEDAVALEDGPSTSTTSDTPEGSARNVGNQSRDTGQ